MVYATSPDAPKERVCPLCGQVISAYHYAEHMVEVHNTWHRENTEDPYEQDADMFEIDLDRQNNCEF